MPYTSKEWIQRVSSRSDMTLFLTHLTRATSQKTVVDILIKILTERKLIASSPETSFIYGNKGAVCFQDTPLSSIGENLHFESRYRAKNNIKKIRYESVGLQLLKKEIFKKGARPVIYDDPSEAKAYLPQSEWWRIVRYDIDNSKNIVDWTHEREWRYPGDLEINLKFIIVVLNSEVYQEFIEKCREIKSEDILGKIRGIVCLNALTV